MKKPVTSKKIEIVGKQKIFEKQELVDLNLK